jgi:phage terminase large subunit
MSDQSNVSPSEFAREDLGLTLWRGQEDVLRAAAEAPRLAVVSGHKTGMTTAAAAAALWFYATRWSRVHLVSPGIVLVNDVLNLLPGRAAESKIYFCSSEFSWWRPDPLEVVGRTELIVVDNADHLSDETLRAIDQATDAGARAIMFGLAKAEPGTLWHQIHHGAHEPRWSTMRLNSEDTPNAQTGERVIHGLATRAWIDEKRREWGPDYASHPLYRSRVLGLFPLESGRAA